MELAPNLQKNKETESLPEITISVESARELAVIALISALDFNQNHEDYASGPDFPNIPFGD